MNKLYRVLFYQDEPIENNLRISLDIEFPEDVSLINAFKGYFKERQHLDFNGSIPYFIGYFINNWQANLSLSHGEPEGLQYITVLRRDDKIYWTDGQVKLL